MKRRAKRVRGKALVIIPTFNSYALTHKHLELLEKQQGGNFDVIVIDSGSSEDHLKLKGERHGFGLFILHFDEDLGGSGSTYEGVKYAMEHGYSYAILSDSDAFPVSKNLINGLTEAAGPDTATFPTNLFKRYCKGSWTDSEESRWAPWHYLTLSRETIGRAGYPRRDLFIYNDDIEYSLRIRSSTRILQMNNLYYEHRNSTLSNYFLKGLSAKASYYTIRNRILCSPGLKGRITPIGNCFFRMLIAFYSLPLGTAMRYSFVLFRAVADGVSGRSGRAEIPKIEPLITITGSNGRMRGAYLTYPERDSVMDRKKAARLGWRQMDISGGVTTAALLRILIGGGSVIVNDLLGNQRITTRLSPFLFLGRLYLLNEKGLFRVTSGR